MNFQPAVYTWTGTAAGSQLWLGATRSEPAHAGLAAMSFPVPGIVLQKGQAYILLLTTLANTSSGSGRFGAVADIAYGGGHFVFQNDGAGTLSRP